MGASGNRGEKTELTHISKRYYSTNLNDASVQNNTNNDEQKKDEFKNNHIFINATKRNKTDRKFI